MTMFGQKSMTKHKVTDNKQWGIFEAKYNIKIIPHWLFTGYIWLPSPLFRNLLSLTQFFHKNLCVITLYKILSNDFWAVAQFNEIDF